MKEILSNKEMLKKVKLENSNENIIEVISFEKNNNNFYDVKVKISYMINNQTHYKNKIIFYPKLKYLQLVESYLDSAKDYSR